MAQAIALGPRETFGAVDVYRVSAPVLVFVQQLASVDVIIDRSSSVGAATVSVSMTGYLVSVP
jgi:hypothetical protein